VASRRARGLGLTLAAAVLWGTSFPANEVGLDVLHPSAFAFWRFAVAGAAAVGLAILRGRWDPSLGREPAIWGLGFFNAAAFGFQYQGQVTTTPARAALFINLDVLWVALGAWLLLDQELGWDRVGAVVLALGGALLLETGGLAQEGLTLAASLDRGLLRGDLLALAGGVAWAGYFLWNDRAVAGEADEASLLAWTFVATAAFLAVPLAFGGATPSTGLGWGAIVYTGLVCTVVAYELWSLGLETLTPTASAIVLVVEILVAAAIAAAIGREAFTPLAGVGAVLVLGAIALAARAEGRSGEVEGAQQDG
jgi:DME family drug/metabolite transporter